MKYNFDELTERRNTGCVKWDSDNDPDMLPLWVADMDFQTAPSVKEAQGYTAMSVCLTLITRL